MKSFMESSVALEALNSFKGLRNVGVVEGKNASFKNQKITRALKYFAEEEEFFRNSESFNKII